MDRRVALLGVASVHLLVALVHGSTHALIPVALAPWQDLLVLVTVFAGPVVGVALDRRGHPLGLPLFTATMAGGLVVGFVLHFLVPGPDHVHAVPAGPFRLPFRGTAVALVVVDALGVAVGGWYWRGR